MGDDAAPVGGLPGLGGAVSRPMIERLESGVLLLRLLRLGRRQPRHPAEQRLEEVGRPRRRIRAFGVIAGDEIAAAAARARLQIGEIGLHARNLPVDLAALRRRIRTEKQEFAILAAERTGRGFGARQLRALPLDGGLRAARTVARGDRLLQARAVGAVLRQRVTGAESRNRRRQRGESAGRRQKPSAPERASHASHRRLHPMKRLCPAPRPNPTGLKTGIAARTRRAHPIPRPGASYVISPA